MSSLRRKEREKCLQFDNSDRDRLAACLPLFGQLGFVSALSACKSDPFHQSFTLIGRMTAASAWISS